MVACLTWPSSMSWRNSLNVGAGVEVARDHEPLGDEHQQDHDQDRERRALQEPVQPRPLSGAREALAASVTVDGRSMRATMSGARRGAVAPHGHDLARAATRAAPGRYRAPRGAGRPTRSRRGPRATPRCAAASVGPMPSSASRSSAVADERLSGPAVFRGARPGRPAPPPARAPAPAPAARPAASAARLRAERSAPRRGPSRAADGLDDPRARGDRIDARAADLAGHVDQGAGRRPAP